LTLRMPMLCGEEGTRSLELRLPLFPVFQLLARLTESVSRMYGLVTETMAFENLLRSFAEPCLSLAELSVLPIVLG